MGESGSAEIQQIDEYQRANLVNDITKELESLKPLSSPECCIYKVPDTLRKLNEEAYTPQVISVGPFHHGDIKLQTMEKYKLRYLKEFMEREKINLETLIHAIEDSEGSVRRCYAEIIPLSRKFYLPLPQSLPRRKSQIIEHMYGATQLDDVGLKFEANCSSKCLLDLHFEKGVLKIPRFTLDNCTELYARNLMALEQCHYPNETYVTDYFLLLHFLIKSEKDVDLLGRKGIMVNGLGNNNASFINSLGTSIVYSTMSSNYYDLCNKLKKFYEEPSHGWLASLRRDYFRTPWMTASTIAAIILLILTLIQTVFSYIQTRK